MNIDRLKIVAKYVICNFVPQYSRPLVGEAEMNSEKYRVSWVVGPVFVVVIENFRSSFLKKLSSARIVEPVMPFAPDVWSG